MSLGFTNVNTIASVACELISSIELRHLGIWSLNREAFDNLTDDLKTIFNLKSLLRARNISISCLFTWRDIFPKNSNDIFLSFLVELSLIFFLFINNLSKNFLTHFSMRNNGVFLPHRFYEQDFLMKTGIVGTNIVRTVK